MTYTLTPDTATSATWTNPANALGAPDSVVARNSTGTGTLVLSQGSGFNVPGGYEIVGFGVRTVAGTSILGGPIEPPPALEDGLMRLEVGLSLDRGVSTVGSWVFDVLGNLAARTAGGVSDLLGREWIRAEVNAATFAIVVRRPSLSGEDPGPPRLVDSLVLDVYANPIGASLVALERQSITQKVLIGKESLAAPGTIVATPIRIMSATVNCSPKGTWKEWTPQGDKLPSEQMLVKEWSESAWDGLPTYDELGYWFANGFGIAADALIATGAYSHRFTFNSRMANTIQPYTLSYGDPEDGTRSHQAGFQTCTDIDLEFDREKADFKAVMMGQSIADGITMSPGVAQVWNIASTATGGTVVYSFKGARTTALAYNATTAAVQTALQALSTVGAGNMLVTGTPAALVITAAGALLGQNLPAFEAPTEVMLLTGGTATLTVPTKGGYTEADLIPILPGQLSIYVSGTYATLSAGKLTRAFVSKVSAKGLRAPFWTQDAAQSSFAGTIEPAAKIEITFTVEADSNGMAFLANTRNNAQMYVRLLATGPLIGATAIAHSFKFEACAKFSALPPFSDKDGVYAAEYKLTVDHDTSVGFSAFLELINGIAAY